jgi:hypothetical protein
MSKIAFSPNASGTGTFTVAAPNTNTDYTLTLPETTGTFALTTQAITQTTGSAPYYGARAWVNFDGTGTPAIRASGNVTSITDNGTGDYTVNFTTAMPDANYSIVATCEDNTKISQYSAATVLVASVRVRVRNLSGTNTDVAVICVAIFR